MSARVVQTGIRLGLGRALSVRSLVIATCIVGFAAAAALAERKLELLGSASRALEGSAFGFLIPLSTFAAVGTVLGKGRLDDATTHFARFGASRRAIALGLLLSSMFAAGCLAAMIAVVTASLAHDPWAPPLVEDVLASAWIGALAGSAYGGVFVLGSTFGARGGGRGIALLLDFVLGGSLGWLATLTPRAHASNLLGAPPPFEAMGQWASLPALLAMAVLSGALATFRCAK